MKVNPEISCHTVVHKLLVHMSNDVVGLACVALVVVAVVVVSVVVVKVAVVVHVVVVVVVGTMSSFSGQYRQLQTDGYLSSSVKDEKEKL